MDEPSEEKGTFLAPSDYDQCVGPFSPSSSVPLSRLMRSY